jgi:hypothetical protein
MMKEKQLTKTKSNDKLSNEDENQSTHKLKKLMTAQIREAFNKKDGK